MLSKQMFIVHRTTGLYGVLYRERWSFLVPIIGWRWAPWRDVKVLEVNSHGSEQLCMGFELSYAQQLAEKIKQNGIAWYRHPTERPLDHWEAAEEVSEWED